MSQNCFEVELEPGFLFAPMPFLVEKRELLRDEKTHLPKGLKTPIGATHLLLPWVL